MFPCPCLILFIFVLSFFLLAYLLNEQALRELLIFYIIFFVFNFISFISDFLLCVYVLYSHVFFQDLSCIMKSLMLTLSEFLQ